MSCHLERALTWTTLGHWDQEEGEINRTLCRQEGDLEWGDRCLAAEAESSPVLHLALGHLMLELAVGCLAHSVVHQTLRPRPYSQAPHKPGPQLTHHVRHRSRRRRQSCLYCLCVQHTHQDLCCAVPKRLHVQIFDHIWGRCAAFRQCATWCDASGHAIDGSEIDMFDTHKAFHGYGSKGGF